ncbi:MAG: ribosome small subunit-dependent GTPase A [Thermoplasmatota archaeon]
MSSRTNLDRLGWDRHFEDSVRALEIEGIEGIDVGRVSFLDGSRYTVITGEGEVRTRASSKVLMAGGPAVGDWVVVKLSGTSNIIISVLPRKGCISRKVPGKEVHEQVFAANVDIIFVMMGLDNDFNLRRLERYLVMVSASGSRPVILLNKSDDAKDLPAKLQQVHEVSGEVPVHHISAMNGDGMDVLDRYLRKGVTVALIGSSGVGKSTLMNRLLGEEKMRTGELRKSCGKGSHVTTSRELMVLPEGGILIDNPGIRELQLWGDETTLEEAFKDILGLSRKCRFKDCQHLSEPGCAVKRALEEGEIERSRFDNYIKMRRELRFLALKTDKGARTEEKARWRPLTKDVKHYQRFKKEGR